VHYFAVENVVPSRTTKSILREFLRVVVLTALLQLQKSLSIAHLVKRRKKKILFQRNEILKKQLSQ
jgi:hypothetical protein